MERSRTVHRVLAAHGVNDEQNAMRTHRRANGFQFAHQLVIDVQSTGGVKENNIVPFVPGSVDGISANRDGFADGPSELGAAFRFPWNATWPDPRPVDSTPCTTV